MTNLQKLIECWRPIEDAHELRIDKNIPDRILAKREGMDRPYQEKILYKSSIDVGEHKPVSFPCWSDSETWKVINPSQHPTHFMPLDTPEKLAKIVGVLVGALEQVRLLGEDGALAVYALQQAEKIAGGE